MAPANLACDRIPVEILGIENDDIAEVAFRVVDIGQDPALVLGLRERVRDL